MRDMMRIIWRDDDKDNKRDYERDNERDNERNDERDDGRSKRYRMRDIIELNKIGET